MKQKSGRLLSMLLIALMLVSSIPIPAIWSSAAAISATSVKGDDSEEIVFNEGRYDYTGVPLAIARAYMRNNPEDMNFTYFYSGIEGTEYYSKDAPTNAGTYNVTATHAINTALSKTVRVTILRRALSILEVTANNRPYDGSNNVTLSGGSLNGVLEVDTGKVGFRDYGTIATPDVGTGKPVTIILTGDHRVNYNFTQPAYLTVDITPKALTSSMLTMQNVLYTYNGNTQTPQYSVSDSAGITVNDYNVTLSHEVIDAGEYTLTITGKNNYKDQISKTFTINKLAPAKGNLTITGLGESEYDGNPRTVTVTEGTGKTGLGGVTVYYDGNKDKPVDAGSYSVTADIDNNGKNYSDCLGLAIGTIVINKKALVGVDGKLNVIAGLEKTYDFNLTELLPAGVPAGQISFELGHDNYEGSIINGAPEIKDNRTLSIPIRKEAIADETFNVSIIFNSKNYDIKSSAVKVTVTNKTLLKINGGSVASRGYNGNEIIFNDSDLTFTDVKTGNTLSGNQKPTLKLTWSSNFVPIGYVPKNAGNYELTVEIVENDNYEIEQPRVINFEIAKAELKIIAANKSMTEGSAIPPFSYTVEGLKEPDTWESVSASGPIYECDPGNPVVVGTYPIVIRGSLNNGAGANYNLSCISGILTVSAATKSEPKGSSSSGSGPAIVLPVVATPIEESPETPDEPEAPAFPFKDVREDAWYYEDVDFVYKRELMNGTETDKFSPGMDLTRATIVTVLYRYAGSPSVAEMNNPFYDVPAGKWYTDAIIWAAANNIVLGYGDGVFAPDNRIKRQELAAILYRYAGFAKINLPEVKEYQLFLDESSFAGYAIEPIGVLCKAGIITGKPGNLFDPNGYATRAEVAVMLHRFVLSVEKAEAVEDAE